MGFRAGLAAAPHSPGPEQGLRGNVRTQPGSAAPVLPRPRWSVLGPRCQGERCEARALCQLSEHPACWAGSTRAGCPHCGQPAQPCPAVHAGGVTTPHLRLPPRSGPPHARAHLFQKLSLRPSGPSASREETPLPRAGDNREALGAVSVCHSGGWPHRARAGAGRGGRVAPWWGRAALQPGGLRRGGGGDHGVLDPCESSARGSPCSGYMGAPRALPGAPCSHLRDLSEGPSRGAGFGAERSWALGSEFRVSFQRARRLL